MVYLGTLTCNDVPCIRFSIMSTKLVRLNLADSLHRRVKTVAAFHDKKIEDYIAEILEEHVPREITFPSDESPREQKPKSVKAVH